MKVRVSHFITKKIEVNSKTRPNPKVVKIEIVDTGRTHKHLLQKLRTVKLDKSLNKNSRKLKRKSTVKLYKSEKEKFEQLSVQNRDQKAAQHDSVYAYTPQVHLLLHQYQAVQIKLNNHGGR